MELHRHRHVGKQHECGEARLQSQNKQNRAHNLLEYADNQAWFVADSDWVAEKIFFQAFITLNFSPAVREHCKTREYPQKRQSEIHCIGVCGRIPKKPSRYFFHTKNSFAIFIQQINALTLYILLKILYIEAHV